MNSDKLSYQQGNTLSLPKGWEIKKLGEVLKLEYGKPLPDEKRTVNGKFPIYGANGLKGRSNDFYFDKKTIVVGRKGSAGEINLTEEKFWPLDVTYFVTFNEREYDLLFLSHLLSLLELPKLAKGVKPGINRNEVYEIEVPLPPLPEQQRIVAILDECFSVIERSRNNAEQNLKNAKELFESYLQGVFEKKGDGWEEKKLGEIGKISMCKRVLKKQTSVNGEIPFYKIGTFGKTPDAFITKELYNDFRNKFSYPKKGDILISASGTIGRRVIFDGSPSYFQDSNIVWIDNDETKVLNQFLFYFYSVAKWKTAKGATISRLYNYILEKEVVNFPKSFEEQEKTVLKLENIQAETQKLEAVYQKKIDDLEELKKSILQKAFSGKLKE